jgi:hypothetical protein
MLFDPGSDLTFIHEKCIPHGATPVVSSITIGTTLAGTFTTSRVGTLNKILLPEFHRSAMLHRLSPLLSYQHLLATRYHRWT